jgi:hypothetical protein
MGRGFSRRTTGAFVAKPERPQASASIGIRPAGLNDAEMATALADLERRIAAAQSGRVSQVRGP